MAETIDFDADGALPAAWIAGVTGKGSAKWLVENDPGAPSPPHALVQFGRGDFPWCVLYYTQQGRRNTIRQVDAPVARNQWHTLRAEFAGKQIRIALDGKYYIELDDDRIGGAGNVGVWTKADSVTAFDDFTFGARTNR